MSAVRRSMRARKQRVQLDLSEAASDDESPLSPAAETASSGGPGVVAGAAERAGDGDYSGGGVDDAPAPAKKPKRRKAAKGKAVPLEPLVLERFKTMPLDILSEICSHLDPGDLLRLARTSRLFRNVLLSSQSIWINARHRFGLPDLSSGITEFEYANLVFGNRCQECGIVDSKIVAVDYYVRRRMCKPCRKLNWVIADKVLDKHPHLHLFSTYCVPTTPYSAADWKYPSFRHEYVLLKNFEAVSNEIEALEIETAAAPPLPRRKVVKSCSTVGRAGLLHPCKVVAFMTAKGEEMSKISTDARLITKALNLKAEAEKMVKQQVKDMNAAIGAARCAAIEQRLRAMGYGDDSLACFFDWRHLPLVKKPEPLTDEIWQRIQPRVIEHLAQKNRSSDQLAFSDRQELRREPVKAAYLAFQDASPNGFIFPLFPVAADLSTIKAMWESDESAFEQSTWDAKLPAIRAELEEWRTNLRIYAIKTILAATTSQTREELDSDPSAYDATTYDDAFFAKPTSFFTCIICDGRSLAGSIGSMDDLIKHQTATHTHQSYHWHDSLTARPFVLSCTMAGAISSIIQIAGVGVDEATAEDLDALGKKLKWENGPNKADRRPCGWRELACRIAAKSRYATNVVADPILSLLA